MKRLKLTIEGMHCAGCVRRVTSALTALDGVAVRDVQVGRADLDYDEDATSSATVVVAVERLGFRAAEVTP